jgi:hypothetical protein
MTTLVDDFAKERHAITMLHEAGNYRMPRKNKFGALAAQWPVAIVMTGIALTVVWIALLVWLSMQLV